MPIPTLWVLSNLVATQRYPYVETKYYHNSYQYCSIAAHESSKDMISHNSDSIILTNNHYHSTRKRNIWPLQIVLSSVCLIKATSDIIPQMIMKCWSTSVGQHSKRQKGPLFTSYRYPSFIADSKLATITTAAGDHCRILTINPKDMPLRTAPPTSLESVRALWACG